jgi:hypothetical protein
MIQKYSPLSAGGMPMVLGSLVFFLFVAAISWGWIKSQKCLEPRYAGGASRVDDCLGDCVGSDPPRCPWGCTHSIACRPFCRAPGSPGTAAGARRARLAAGAHKSVCVRAQGQRQYLAAVVQQAPAQSAQDGRTGGLIGKNATGEG